MLRAKNIGYLQCSQCLKGPPDSPNHRQVLESAGDGQIVTTFSVWGGQIVTTCANSLMRRYRRNRTPDNNKFRKDDSLPLRSEPSR